MALGDIHPKPQKNYILNVLSFLLFLFLNLLLLLLLLFIIIITQYGSTVYIGIAMFYHH